MRKLFVGVVFLGLSNFAFAAGFGDPAAIVSEVVRMDKGGWEPIFAEKPTALMRRYFTDAFNTSWTVAMSHNHDEPVLDGDPLTGDQSVTGVKLRATRVSAGGDTASVAAEVLVDTDGAKPGRSKTIAFSLRRESGGWKIDDIKSANMPSLRSYFKKNYGG